MGNVVPIIKAKSKFAVDRDRFDGFLTTLLREELALPNNAHPMAVCAVLLDAVGRVWVNTYRSYADEPSTIAAMRGDILQVLEMVRQTVASADPLKTAEEVSTKTVYTTEVVQGTHDETPKKDVN